ncbi:MAG: site-2 protease family protein [Verrucomicrobiales bacterium]
MQDHSANYNSLGAPPPPPHLPPQKSGWQKAKAAGGVLAALFFLVTKFKAFLLPALKFLPAILKTGGTMILSIFAYSMMFGWHFALGFVLLIFIHEIGHLLAAKKVGLKVSAPMFIPFMGALISLKEAPRNAWIEAQIGIGGPILGSIGSALCIPLFYWTGNYLFLALAYTGFFLNLFNLVPIGFLDGGRIVTVLSPWLWLVGAVIMLYLLVTDFNFLVLLIFLLSLPRVVSLFRRRTDAEQRYFEATPQQRIIMACLYFGLAAALLFGMKMSFFNPEQRHKSAPPQVASL